MGAIGSKSSLFQGLAVGSGTQGCRAFRTVHALSPGGLDCPPCSHLRDRRPTPAVDPLLSLSQTLPP